MTSHVFALGLSWIAYRVARRYSQLKRISLKKENLYALAGFSSTITLQFVAIVMVVESV